MISLAGILAAVLVFLLPAVSSADARPLKAEIIRQLAESSPWVREEVEVDEIQVQGLDLSAAYDSVRVEVPRGMKTLGKIAISVTASAEGREKTAWGSARVRAFRDAVVALNTLKINARIGRDDIKVARMEVRDVPDALWAADEAEGMLVKRPIQAGSVIKRDYLKPEVLVKRGDPVVLNVENGKIRIRSRGVAVEDGGRGGVVTAKTASGKEVTGKVTAPGEVTVEF